MREIASASVGAEFSSGADRTGHTIFASTAHAVDAAAKHDGTGSAVGVQQIPSRLQLLSRYAIDNTQLHFFVEPEKLSSDW